MNIRYPRLQPDWTEHITKLIVLSVILGFSFLFLLGCGSSNGINYDAGPELLVECAYADAAGCDENNIGKTIFVGLTAETGANCSPLLDGVVGAGLASRFDYSAQFPAEMMMTGVLGGVAMRWVNSQQMPVVQLPADTIFKVCAFIDLNDNQKVDAFEPVDESTLMVSGDILPLSSWSNY